jgi:hypothetical protein
VERFIGERATLGKKTVPNHLTLLSFVRVRHPAYFFTSSLRARASPGPSSSGSSTTRPRPCALATPTSPRRRAQALWTALLAQCSSDSAAAVETERAAELGYAPRHEAQGTCRRRRPLTRARWDPGRRRDQSAADAKLPELSVWPTTVRSPRAERGAARASPRSHSRRRVGPGESRRLTQARGPDNRARRALSRTSSPSSDAASAIA